MPETSSQYASQWGMLIDLDRCTGCSACVVACNAENNIPTTGDEQSARGRNMQWIHVQRFYEGDYPNVRTFHAPMLCQHCGNAPCESVCPVFAASHSSDGLNQQIYNRCIGTRFCANNCPYHVRVFNFYEPYWPEPLDQQLNPDVTIRGAGVMEKCTFCVQRIRRAETEARVQSRKLLDGELRPACVQACPSHAMIFGKLSDKTSTVSRMWEDNASRSVRVLQDKNTQPAVVYLKRVQPREADVL